MAGKRFGRNQKRKLKAEIALLEKQHLHYAQKLKAKDANISRAKYILQTLYKIAPNNVLFEPAMTIREHQARGRHDMFTNNVGLLDVTGGRSYPEQMLDIKHIDLYKLEVFARDEGLSNALHFDVALINDGKGALAVKSYSLTEQALHFMGDYHIEQIGKMIAIQMLSQLASIPRHEAQARRQRVRQPRGIENFINEL